MRGWPRDPQAPGEAEYSQVIGAHKAPGRSGTPGAPGGRRRPSICPHKAPQRWSARRCSGPAALASGGRLRHAALGWRDQTPWSRRQTAAPTGWLPPRIWDTGVASGQQSTDSNDAGDQVAPGLRSPQRTHPQTYSAGGSSRCPSLAPGVAGAPRGTLLTH